MAERAHGSIFLNCPFDPTYKPIFDAIVFTVVACGFRIRSALELADSGELRLEKIYRLIDSTSHSVHDISRVETDAGSGLPRFNMPIELGIALGHRRFGAKSRKPKLLILDSERFRYQRFASDLAGLDISEHGNTPVGAIEAIRNFLAGRAPALPSPDHIKDMYYRFENQLPALAARRHQTVTALTYSDRLRLAQDFIELFA